MLVLIAGTPGVGKTTVAREVAKRLGVTYVNVAELAVNEGLVAGYDSERGAYVIDEEAVRAKLRELALRGRAVVDTHVVSAVPPELVEVAIVLRLDPRELERRLKARGYPPSKVLENVQAEILDACLIEAVEAFGEERTFEVDASGKSVDEVVEEVLKIVKERRGGKPGSVNWLERLGDEAYRYLTADAQRGNAA
jgi:adenylate kinase